MTLAEQFRREGHQEGHQQGRQEGLLEGIASLHRALLEVLEVRFGAVPVGLGETLSTVSDLEKLKALHRAALTSPDLESFASGI
jgi:predicted transposase YdaD